MRQASWQVPSGEEAEIELNWQAPRARPELVKESQNLKVLWQDEKALAIEKPAFMHSIRQDFEDPVCLSDVLVAGFPDLELVGRSNLEGGLVQRLDFYTSGVMLAAKDRGAWDELHRQFISDKTEKTYLALVEGRVKKQVIRKTIDPSASRKRVKVLEGSSFGEEDKENTPAQKLQITEILDSQGFSKQPELSLVLVRARNVVRHQVRAHLASIGRPLVGDVLYGSNSSLPEAVVKKDLRKEKEGFFLHARTIKFISPDSGEPVEVESSLSEIY